MISLQKLANYLASVLYLIIIINNSYEINFIKSKTLITIASLNSSNLLLI